MQDTTPKKPFEARTTTTRQQRKAVQVVEQMKPGQTVVFHFDGCNLTEMVSGSKWAPEVNRR